jgi:predicted kinase
MEAVVFCGIQGSGKSGFYQERFYLTHVRINLDMLRTRHREALLLKACLEGKTRFVVDNTNPTVEDRARYVAPARAAGFRVCCYWFASTIEDALARNAARPAPQRVPISGVFGTHQRMQLPSYAEGFDELKRVRLVGAPGAEAFLVEDWREGMDPGD